MSDGPVVALVGVGRWGAIVLRDLRLLGCDVVVWARSAATATRAQASGAIATVDRVEDLPHVDAAFVCTPSATHAEVVLELARTTTSPVFVEKPMTLDLGSAEHLVGVLGDRLFVLDKWRHHEGVALIRGWIESNAFGVLRGVSLERVQQGHGQSDSDVWWDLGSHDLAIALELLTELPPVLAARGVTGSDGRLEHAVVLLGQSPWVELTVSARSCDFRRSVTAYFDTATVRMVSNSVTVLTLSGVSEVYEFARAEPLLMELRSALTVAGGSNATFKSSAVEGLAVVRSLSEVADLLAR